MKKTYIYEKIYENFTTQVWLKPPKNQKNCPKFEQAAFMENSSQSHQNNKITATQPKKKVTGNKDFSFWSVLENTEEQWQLLFSSDAFGTYCWMDKVLETTAVTQVSSHRLDENTQEKGSSVSILLLTAQIFLSSATCGINHIE